MECPDKQQPPSSSENDLVSSTSTSEVTSLQDFQAPVDPRAGTADDLSAQTDGATGTQAAAKTPLENLPEEKGKWF